MTMEVPTEAGDTEVPAAVGKLSEAMSGTG